MPDDVDQITMTEVATMKQSDVNFLLIDTTNKILRELAEGNRKFDELDEKLEQRHEEHKESLNSHIQDSVAHTHCNNKKTRKQHAKDAGLYVGLPSLLASIIYGVIELLK